MLRYGLGTDTFAGRKVIYPLTAWLCRARVRNAIAYACAAMFLFMTLAHGFQHAHAAGGQPAYEMSVGEEDGGTTDQQMAASVEHCCACCVAMPVITFTLSDGLDIQSIPAGRVIAVQSSPPFFELPPPIAMI